MATNGISYVAENALEQRIMSKKYGNWHIIYTRMSRWSKNGVLGRIFERLEKERPGENPMEVASLNRAYIKIYPDGTRAVNWLQSIRIFREKRMIKPYMVAVNVTYVRKFSPLSRQSLQRIA
jgi:transposase